MKIKRISMLLVLVMILSAFAGTFTFAGAETAGGTFTVNGGAPITGQICKQALKDGDVVVLQSDYVVTATENGAFTAGITIDGDSNGDGKADHTVTASARWFNYGKTGDAATDSYADKPLTFKNLNFVMTATCDNIVQSQNYQANITVDNCTFDSVSAKGRAFTLANGTHQTLTVTNSKITVRAAGECGFFWCNTANNVLNITDTELVATGFRGTGSNKGCFVWMYGKNQTLNMTGVTADSSMAAYHRLAYVGGGGTAGTWNLKDSVFIGSNDSHDVFQVLADTTLNFENTVFVGGGSHNTGDNIIRSSNVPYYGSEDSYNYIKILGRSSAYATDADLLKHLGMDPTVTGTDYDAAAARMGYKARIGDAATAYADGKFTGYYTCLKDIQDKLGNSIRNNTAIFVIADMAGGLEKTNYTYFNESTLSLEGVDTDGDGVYPTVISTTPLFRAAYKSDNSAQTEGTLIYKNLNFEMINSWFGQLNYGTMTVENCNVVCGGTHAYGIVVQEGTTFNLINSTMIYTGTGNNIRLNSAKSTANVTNSTVRTTHADASPVYVNNNSDLNVSENSRFLVEGAKGIVIANGKTLFLNGERVKSSITAGAMRDGATVRISAGERLVNSGIRFESDLTEAQVRAAESSGATVSYGTVIFRYEDLGTKTVAELVDAANADENDDLIVVDVKAVNGILDNDDGSKTIRVAIVDMKEKNYDLALGAVAYVELTYEDGSAIRIYGVFDAEKNVCSVKEAARAALLDYKTEIGAVDGVIYYNEIIVEINGEPTPVYSCYTNEQLAFLEIYAGK